VLTNADQQHAIHQLEVAGEQAQAPLLRIEQKLHGVVAFGIMPLFALANAGVHFGADLFGALSAAVTIGIVLGLVIGKPLGITLFAWTAARLGVAALPSGSRWRTLHGVSWLGGIGFTMSLFIAGLAFPSSPELLDSAKVGILVASVIAGLAGWIMLRRPGPPRASTGDEGTREVVGT
jgi:NhaA family Na+:H+ antiporter